MAQSFRLKNKIVQNILKKVESWSTSTPGVAAKVIDINPLKTPNNLYKTYTFSLFHGSSEKCSVDGWG